MIVKDVLERTTLFFKEKNIESSRLDAELLLARALNLKDRVGLYLKFDQPLNEEELQIARDFVRRRSQGEPVAYILGEKWFYGYLFQVSSAVLIPRPETEILVERAIEWVEKNRDKSDLISVLDLGSGSGCIGISVVKDLQKKGFEKVDLVLVDISEPALLMAKKNSEFHQVKSVKLIHQDVNRLDIFNEFSVESFDLILANPPYVAEGDSQIEENVKKYEPNCALYSSGPAGTEFLHSWSERVIGWLKKPGLMGFEMGKDHGQIMKSHFEKLAVFGKIELIQDLSHLDRHIVGIKMESKK